LVDLLEEVYIQGGVQPFAGNALFARVPLEQDQCLRANQRQVRRTASALRIKPKPDDALPVRAVGRLWEEVHLAGDFARPWNHHRFKAIRDLLSQHGHIDWADCRFQNLPEGKGRCCRWQISFALRSLLSSLMGEATVVDTAARFADGPHEFHTPQWFNFARDRQLRWWAEAERQVEMLFAA
jgi:hypothetical protein